ncbi:hypothetical protein GCM10023152_30330 [Agromyces bauzanensis]
MPVTLNPYLNFRDNAREALEFYHDVLGGELTISTFADSQAARDPAENDLVMHGQIDGAGDDDATLRGYRDRLTEGRKCANGCRAAPHCEAPAAASARRPALRRTQGPVGVRELRDDADVLGLQALRAAGGLEFDLLVLLE